MTVEEENKNDRLEKYKNACQNLGAILDTQIRGYEGSPKSKTRAQKVERSVLHHGNDALLNEFKEVYIEGFSIVVSTLNSLTEQDIHTNDQLLNLDIDEAIKKEPRFGPEKATVTRLMKEVIISKKALE